MSSFISKTLNDYLFGGEEEEEFIEMSLGKWQEYKPIKNPITENHNYVQERKLPKFIFNIVRKYAKHPSKFWPLVVKCLYKKTYGYFETYGEDLEFVKKQNPLCIWTEVHASGSFEGIQSGFMSVDRMIYFVTEVPRDKKQFISIDYHDDCQDEYEYPRCCEKECYICEDILGNDDMSEVSKGKFKCDTCEEEE
tara:strand:- start:291 stop:872 length:582 start_codon:yes stop_codon:yes gene_type:complete